MGAFLVALSGLQANSTGLQAVGHNIANSNTVGYKANNVFQQELSYRSEGGLKIGLGVTRQTRTDWTPGTIAQTKVATNMAIRGEGFFIVSDGVDQFFTRAGDFLVNKEGQLATSDGLLVLGYPAVDGKIDTNAALTGIEVNKGILLEPLATENVRYVANLNSATAVAGVFSTSIVFFDSLGAEHSLSALFTKTASGWDYELTIPPEDLAGGVAGDPAVVVTSGSMTFNSLGKLISPAADVTGIDITASASFANGAADQTLTWELYGTGGSTFLTQFDLPSSTAKTQQDGRGASTLSAIFIRADGVIEGQFTEVLGQVVVATFINPFALHPAGRNSYSGSSDSGPATPGVPGTGGRGQILGSALENSNVDITEEFIKLILFQRAYQANSRVVLTADEVTQEAIQLKR